MCEGSWRRRSAVVQEPTAHVQEAVPDQTPNRVHALFFHVFLVPALPYASAQLPATLVFPPGTAFQAFGMGLLNSRLPCSICWTLHRTIQCAAPLVASPAEELHLSWAPAGSVSQPASCPAVVLCTQVWGYCLFWAVQHSLSRLRGCSFPRGSCSIHGALLWFKTQDG